MARATATEHCANDFLNLVNDRKVSETVCSTCNKSSTRTRFYRHTVNRIIIYQKLVNYQNVNYVRELMMNRLNIIVKKDIVFEQSTKTTE